MFGTAGIRERVLAGWSAAPVRFREDANAEEDLALGGYVDRLVIELAQNAADAAARADVQGRVLYEFRGSTLVVANTGTPLSAEGVESLATLRASAKRDEPTVGRFGVGFSAVLAVTDEPVILSRTGGVRFSKADTAAAIAGLGSAGLDTEVRRRDGQVPVLRLPFEAEGEPPEGYDTAVILPSATKPPPHSSVDCWPRRETRCCSPYPASSASRSRPTTDAGSCRTPSPAGGSTVPPESSTTKNAKRSSPTAP